MTKTNATPLDALLDGADLIPGLPGTRPDLAAETAALARHLDPVLANLPEAEPPEGVVVRVPLLGVPQTIAEGPFIPMTPPARAESSRGLPGCDR